MGAGFGGVGGTPSSDEEKRLFRRLEERRDGASADTAAARGPGAFASAEYVRTDKDETRFEQGYRSDGAGGTLGIDQWLTPRILAGLALNYTNVRGAFDRFGGAFDQHAYGPFLYGSILPGATSFVDVSIGYTRRVTDIARRPPGVTALSATTEANEYRLGVLSGYDFVVNTWTVGPRLGITYWKSLTDAYREHGLTGAELAYDARDQESLTSVLGLYGSTAIGTRFAVIVPQATLEYVHEFENDQRTSYSRAVADPRGTRLPFKTEAPDRDYGHVTLGVLFITRAGFVPFINYRELLQQRRWQRHTITLGLRFEF